MRSCMLRVGYAMKKANANTGRSNAGANNRQARVVTDARPTTAAAYSAA
jgi:hypothetical protein